MLCFYTLLLHERHYLALLIAEKFSEKKYLNVYFFQQNCSFFTLSKYCFHFGKRRTRWLANNVYKKAITHLSHIPRPLVADASEIRCKRARRWWLIYLLNNASISSSWPARHATPSVTSKLYLNFFAENNREFSKFKYPIQAILLFFTKTTVKITFD